MIFKHVVPDNPLDNVRVITAYYPDTEEWEEGLKTRRKSL